MKIFKSSSRSSPTNRCLVILLCILIISGLLAACASKDKGNESDTLDSATPETSLQPTVTDATSEPSATITEPTLPTSESGEPINPLTGLTNMDPNNAGKRSVAIVVNNHYSSLPQRGLHKADVIYEYETESGQTRLLAVFADVNTVPEIGSVRSARIVSADLCGGTNSIYIHFGENNRVPARLAEYGIPNVDGNAMCASSGHSVNGEITLPDNLFFYRDDTWKSKRALEHTAVTNGALLLGAIEHKGISFEGNTPMLFDFVDSPSPSLSNGTPCTDMTVFFSLTNNDANFVYDKDTLLYTKYQYNGTAQIDEITGEKIYVKNVFVLFADIRSHGDVTVDVFLEEGGAGYYVSEGKLIKITWVKASPTSPIEIYDESGDPVQVNSGKSYINIVRQTQSDKTTWE